MKFVFDLDGTLCFDGMTMSKELQEVLLTAPKYGHEIIFATARSYRDCISILEGELKKLTVVGLNGGEVFQDEHLVSQYTIPSHALRTIVSYCDTYNLPYFIEGFCLSKNLLSPLKLLFHLQSMRIYEKTLSLI